ncbi:MAG: hypothetical protein R3F59_03090 [Myxococcota bacterium]
MDPMAPIAGVSLEQYATLCVAMADTGEDKAAQARIAAEHGVDEASWNEAMTGWTARMQDPALQGKVSHAFVPLFQAAQAAKRGGKEPETLEIYAKVVAGCMHERDAAGNKPEPHTVFGRYGHTQASWNEVTAYWAPKTMDPADPTHPKFAQLLQDEADRILGIDRNAPEPDEDEDDADADASQEAPAASAPADDGVVGMLMGFVRKLVG